MRESSSVTSQCSRILLPTTKLWLLTHGDLKQAARIQAVVGALGAALAEERALFEGQRGLRLGICAD